MYEFLKVRNLDFLNNLFKIVEISPIKRHVSSGLNMTFKIYTIQTIILNKFLKMFADLPPPFKKCSVNENVYVIIPTCRRRFYILSTAAIKIKMNSIMHFKE